MSSDWVKLVFEFGICRYTSAAALSVWAYDFLLTVADEIELLWSKNGAIVKFLYLIVSFMSLYIRLRNENKDPVSYVIKVVVSAD